MLSSFLIKYSEIGVKGKNRHVFEEALCRQIRFALKHCSGEFEVHRNQGRIYIYVHTEFDMDDVTNALSKVFGIAGICPVKILEDEGLPALRKEAASYIHEEYPEGEHTFKVMTRRARKNYPIDSMEVSAAIGEEIIEACPRFKVDVHDPELFLHIEIREKIYMYSRIIPGPGGMPVGSSGRAMLLLSGGIDSPVAGYRIAKRGVRLEAVYFHAPPYTSERAKQKVVDLARIISPYTGPIKLHIINFTDIQLYIYEKCPHDELTIIMRRYMMRIAEHLAYEGECHGLVTGESIGQVASQTMQSMISTNEVCTLPVYRPLCGFDKQEIVDISEAIGTYETSILPFEDCCTIFVAKHPVTKPNVKVIRRHETFLKEKIDDMVKTAIETREIVTCQAD